MYPTERPEARAKPCLSCHLGTESKFATHRIMGAGHPRISFELDTFTEIQPAVFGRIGSRPFNLKEMQKLYLDDGGKPWAVTDRIERAG